MSKPNGVVLALICLSANLLTLKAADPPTIKIFDVIVNLGTAEANSNCKERKTFFINTQFEVSFLQAYLICDRYGYELATLESPNEQTNLFKYLETRYKKEIALKARFWIGATNSKPLEAANSSPKTWPFYWFKTGRNVSFPLTFHAGLPDNSANEHCLEIYKKATGEYGCNDLACSSGRGFICQMNEC